MDYIRGIQLDYNCNECNIFMKWLHSEFCLGLALMIYKEGIVKCITCKKTCNILNCKWKCNGCGTEES